MDNSVLGTFAVVGIFLAYVVYALFIKRPKFEPKVIELPKREEKEKCPECGKERGQARAEERAGHAVGQERAEERAGHAVGQERAEEARGHGREEHQKEK